MTKNQTIIELAKTLRDAMRPEVSDKELEDALTEKFGEEGLINANSILAESDLNIEFVVKRAEEKLNAKTEE